MKIDPARFIRGVWSLLTEVPGRPNASIRARWRRALPIAVPVVGMLLLASWKIAVSDPYIRARDAQHQPLLELERTVAGLRLTCSDRAARDLKTQASAAAASLMSGPQAIGKTLSLLQKNAAIQRWEASFEPVDVGGESPAKDAFIGFLRAKGSLHPMPDNSRPWETLLVLLDQVSTPAQPIDLTRLVIRADEEGRYSVETDLRMAYLIDYEKVAQ